MAGAGTLTVASMNLHWGFSSAGDPFDVAAVIRGLDAQIIAVQETWTAESAAADPLAVAARETGASLRQGPLCPVRDLASLGLPGGSGPGHVGQAVLTTLPVAGYELLSLGAVPRDATSRIAQVLWLTLEGRPTLRLVNTHLSYRGFSPVQLWRLRQALRGHSGPTIITGDLNMPRTIASLTSGYAPAVDGRTWPADRPILQLDHVLANGALEPITGTVLPHAGSDHLPVRAELRLRAARNGVSRAGAPAADHRTG